MGYTYINIDSVFGAAVSLLILSVLAVALRITLRWRGAAKSADIIWSKHVDDMFCILALVPTIGTTVVMIYGARKGIVGGHNDASNIENWIMSTTPTLVILEKLVYITFILQPLALGCIKLAFLFFYRRIFVTRNFQITSFILILVVIGWMLAFFFGFVFDCRLNFSANWGSLASIAENCPFGFLPTIIFTVLDAFLDLCILLLPLPWILRLQMPMTRRIQVCGVFLLGGFAVAAATVRMVICIKQNTPSNALEQQYIMGMPTYDIIGITSHGLFWTLVEVNVALIACCLPTLRPILSMAAFGTLISSFGSFLQAMGSMMGSTKSTNNDSANSSGKFSKMSRGTVGSTPRHSEKRSGAMSPTGSDISLVEIERKLGEVHVAREVHVVHDPYDEAYNMDPDEKRYLGNSARGHAAV